MTERLDMENDTERPGAVLVISVLLVTMALAGLFGYLMAWGIDRWIL